MRLRGGRLVLRILIGTVGYRNLSDFSVGPNLLTALQRMEWDGGVEVEDLSYGPIAVVQNLEDRPPYDRMIFLSAAQRGRTPGRVYRTEWMRERRSDEEIQARITEAITGVIDLDNLLVIAHYFRVLAPEAIVIEVEPLEIESGENCGAVVDALRPRILEMVRAEAYGRIHSSVIQ